MNGPAVHPESETDRTMTAIPPDAPFLSIGFSARELCTRCGSCAGVCPEEAIELDERKFPRLIPDRCTRCGLCAAVCPGAEVRFGELSEQVFGRRNGGGGFDGQVAKTYVGYSTDARLRSGGAGGGMVTALLWHLLRTGAADGVLVTRMNRERPWEAEPFLATTYEELVASQGSRYAIIPMNVLWRELRRHSGRLAAAILPCQTHGFRRLQKADPELAGRLTAVVGLFCGGSLEPVLAREMLAVRGIRRGAVADFKFRGGDWPGQMQAVLKDGRVRPLHYSNYKDGAYNYLTSLYMPERCQTCLDGSNEFADVAVSDAWTRDEKGEYKFKAHSRLLVRTERGAELVRAAAEAGDIVLTDVSADPSYQTHRMQTRRKGSLAPLRVERWKKAGRRVPLYDRGPPDDATRRERLTERLSSALLRAGKWRPFRMAAMGFLTSCWAIPLIRLRLWLKKRKYAKRR
ncbi:MAG: 4Fe-4S dicluster domain-containing protein [Opitutae bacterium]|nr:4Fe-4S dicluster domain-containing protein [Opitutae bacterium]